MQPLLPPSGNVIFTTPLRTFSSEVGPIPKAQLTARPNLALPASLSQLYTVCRQEDKPLTLHQVLRQRNTHPALSQHHQPWLHLSLLQSPQLRGGHPEPARLLTSYSCHGTPKAMSRLFQTRILAPSASEMLPSPRSWRKGGASLVSGIAPTALGSFSSAETWQSYDYKLRVKFNEAFI